MLLYKQHADPKTCKPLSTDQVPSLPCLSLVATVLGSLPFCLRGSEDAEYILPVDSLTFPGLPLCTIFLRFIPAPAHPRIPFGFQFLILHCVHRLTCLAIHLKLDEKTCVRLVFLSVVNILGLYRGCISTSNSKQLQTHIT